MYKQVFWSILPFGKYNKHNREASITSMFVVFPFLLLSKHDKSTTLLFLLHSNTAFGAKLFTAALHTNLCSKFDDKWSENLNFLKPLITNFLDCTTAVITCPRWASIDIWTTPLTSDKFFLSLRPCEFTLVMRIRYCSSRSWLSWQPASSCQTSALSGSGMPLRTNECKPFGRVDRFPCLKNT